MFLWQRCLETEGGCTVNVRRKREEKRLLPDCPGTKKKRDTFFISYLAYKEKNIKKEAKIAEEGDGENCWAQCKEVNLFSLGTCLKGLGWSLKSFSKKILNELKQNKEKLQKKNKIENSKKKKKRLNAQVGDEVYFVIRKGESSLRYTQRLSSSDIKLQFLFCLFMF